MNAFQRIAEGCTKLLSQLLRTNRRSPTKDAAAPAHLQQKSTTNTLLKVVQPKPTGRAQLLQGHTIISRATPPRPQDVYFIYPPAPQETEYASELREVTFTKDADGSYIPNRGRTGKHRQTYATLAELAQTFNIESEDWQIIR